MDEHFRRTARRNIELAVRYRRAEEESTAFAEAQGTLEQIGRMVDLGLGGAQIRCERPPPIGTRIHLRLRSPSAWDPLELEGTVRWIDESAGDGPLFGLAFDKLAAAEAAALFELLDAHAFTEKTE
jgi:hypothetical protein